MELAGDGIDIIEPEAVIQNSAIFPEIFLPDGNIRTFSTSLKAIKENSRKPIKGGIVMNDLESRRRQMFNRVLNFAAVNADAFSPSSYGSELLAEMRNIVDQLSLHGKAQETGSLSSRQGTANKSSLREELREDLLQISRTARSIVVDKPFIEEKFRLAKKLNDQQLLDKARTFAEIAAPYKEDFIRLEMPKDFLEQLNENISLFEQAVNDQQQGITTQMTATAAIDDVIERGMIVVGILDAIVRNKFDNDSSILAAWVGARHTERLPRPSPPVPATDAPSVSGN